MELAEVVGQLSGLRRFAVRSLGGESPDEALVRGPGLVGDRIYGLFDEEEGAPLTARNAPFLLRYRVRYLDSMVEGGDLEPWIRVKAPDGSETPLSDPRWVNGVAQRYGRPVSLRRTEATANSAPLHLLSVPTVRFLEKQYGGPLEPMRLRSNLLLELPEARAFEEDRWIGRQIWIGDVLLEIVKQCDECIVTSLDAQTTERSPGVLNAIARGRGGMTGVYARALTGNRVRVGDPVSIVG